MYFGIIAIMNEKGPLKMEKINWFSVTTVILLLLILGVLWLIKEVLEDKKEADATIIRNSRRFRQFVTKDYFFQKSHRKINQEIIKELQTTYGAYDEINELKDELLGINVQIKDESSDFGFILTAVFTLLLSLFIAFNDIPSAINIIPLILILGAVASYLNEIADKINYEEGDPGIILFSLPVILTITTLTILGVLLATGLKALDTTLINWLFKVIIIEAAFLYLILLYEKVQYINYLEIVTIVLNEMILEEDRKNWLIDK